MILFAAALPGLCPPALDLARHPPDVWVALVVYLALRGRGYRAVGWGITLGALRDCFSLDPLGTHAFVLGLVAYLFSEGRIRRGPMEGAPRVLFTFVAALIAGWLTILRLLPLGVEPLTWTEVWYVVPTALFTTVFAAFLYPLLDHFRLFDDLLGRAHGLPA